MATEVSIRANASHLSDSQYGYDAVLSVTQVSLNDNVRAFVLNKVHATQKLYWTASSQGKLVPSTYSTINSMENVDPLTFSSTNPPSASVRQGLWTKGFRLATSSTLGANERTVQVSIPRQMVSFTSDAQNIILTPIWRDFTLVALTEDLQWHVYSQDPSYPWSISPVTKVSTIVQHSTPPNPHGPTFPTSTFYVPTMAIDFSQTAGWNINIRPNLPADTNNQLSSVASNLLAASFRDASLPIATISSKTTPWSVGLLTYEYMINPYIDNSGHTVTVPTPVQADATTLNYLCCTALKKLPPARSFTWNWIEAGQVNPYHGVFALNRNTFRDYIHTQIYAQVKQSCIAIVPSCSPILVRGSSVPRGYIYYATFTAGQLPEITKKDTSTQVLFYGWSNNQTSTSGQASFHVSSGYECSVDFQDDQIIIRQREYGWIDVTWPGQPTQSGWVIDKQFLDTYTIAVNQFGGLSWSVTHQTIDNTPDQSKNPAITSLKEHSDYDFIAGLTYALKDFKPMSWGSYAAGSPAPSFILPAGTTFSCANARFSDHQDLIVNLMYAT